MLSVKLLIPNTYTINTSVKTNKQKDMLGPDMCTSTYTAGLKTDHRKMENDKKV